MKIKFVHNLALFSCLFISTMGFLHGTAGSWVNLSSGDWDVAGNWVTKPGGSFPNAPGDIADFTVPLNPATIISLSTLTNITIGSLHVNSPGSNAELFINFPTINDTLTFDNGASSIPATLFSANTFLFIGSGGQPFPTVVLNSPLEIFAKGENFTPINFVSSITGTGPITFSGDDNGTLTFSNANFYTGDTIVTSGGVSLQSTSTPGHAIPGNFFISGGVFASTILVQPGFDDQFDHASIGNLSGGGVLVLEGTNQIFQALNLSEDCLVLNDSANPNTLTLNGINPINMTGNAFLTSSTIRLLNGGISYDNFFSSDNGQGNIGFLGGPASTIDLNANSTTFNISGTNNFPADLVFTDVNITNTPQLTFSGFGIFELAETLGSLPTNVIVDGPFLQIGDAFSFPRASVGATGVVALFGFGSLGGFGTIGTSGLVEINNVSGTVQPGFPSVNGKEGIPGTLTVSGSYVQGPSGTLIIKSGLVSSFHHTAEVTDQLVVQEGTVHLDGALFFNGLPGNEIVAGDEFVIIDNSTGSAPITGTFSEVISAIPEHLVLSVVYNPQQVVVKFTATGICPPCPAFMLLPPTDLEAHLIKNVFLTETEKFIRLTFHPSPSEDLKEYRIYRNNKLIGVLKATLHFDDHIKIRKTTEKYSVTSISTSGVESAPVITYFTPSPW